MKRKEVYEILDSIKGVKGLIDVGCGDCSQLIQYTKIHPDSYHVGIDIKPIIKSLPDKVKAKIYVITADARMLAIRNHVASIITSTEVIEHFMEGEEFIEEASRCLKNNGWIVIATPNRLSKLVKTIISRLLGISIHNPHVREYTIYEIKTILKRHGVKTLCYKYIALDSYALSRLSTPYIYSVLNGLFIFESILAPILKWDFIVVGIEQKTHKGMQQSK